MNLRICFDPGRICGWSVFRKGRLIRCGYGSKELYLNEPLIKNGDFIVERPRDYPGTKRQAPPNDLLEVDFLAGQLEALYRLAGCKTSSVWPRSWKGTIPKPKRKGEIYILEERVIDRLDEEELVVLNSIKTPRSGKYDHNGIDGVGMNLWAEGRL